MPRIVFLDSQLMHRPSNMNSAMTFHIRSTWPFPRTARPRRRPENSNRALSANAATRGDCRADKWRRNAMGAYRQTEFVRRQVRSGSIEFWLGPVRECRRCTGASACILAEDLAHEAMIQVAPGRVPRCHLLRDHDHAGPAASSGRARDRAQRRGADGELVLGLRGHRARYQRMRTPAVPAWEALRAAMSPI